MKRSILVMALALLLAAMACGPLSGATGDVFEEIEGELEGEGSVEDIPDYTFETIDYSGYNSYVVNLTAEVVSTSEEGGNVTLDLQLSDQKDPVASQLIMDIAGEGSEAFGMEGEGGRIALYEVDGISYVEFSGGDEDPFCFGSATDEEEEEDPADEFLDAVDLSGEEITWEAIGSEEVNGVMTYHYRATEVDSEDFTEATADIYVSQEDSTIRRLILTGTGTLDESMGEGDITITYDLLSVNEPIEVTVPEYCTTF